MAAHDNQPNELEQLLARYRELNIEKTLAEERLKGSEKKLRELQQQALERFKTDDLLALNEQLGKLEKENQEKLEEYRGALDDIEEKLARIEEGDRQ